MFRFLGRYLRGIQGKPRSAVAAAFRMSQRTRHDEFRMGTLWQPQLDLVAGKQLKTADETNTVARHSFRPDRIVLAISLQDRVLAKMESADPASATLYGGQRAFPVKETGPLTWQRRWRRQLVPMLRNHFSDINLIQRSTISLFR